MFAHIAVKQLIVIIFQGVDAAHTYISVEAIVVFKLCNVYRWASHYRMCRRVPPTEKKFYDLLCHDAGTPLDDSGITPFELILQASLQMAETDIKTNKSCYVSSGLQTTPFTSNHKTNPVKACSSHQP